MLYIYIYTYTMYYVLYIHIILSKAVYDSTLDYTIGPHYTTTSTVLHYDVIRHDVAQSEVTPHDAALTVVFVSGRTIPSAFCAARFCPAPSSRRASPRTDSPMVCPGFRLDRWVRQITYFKGSPPCPAQERQYW